MSRIVSALFPNAAAAEIAVQQLRTHGVPDAAITVVSQQAHTVATPVATTVEVVEETPGKGVAAGLTAGATKG